MLGRPHAHTKLPERRVVAVEAAAPRPVRNAGRRQGGSRDGGSRRRAPPTDVEVDGMRVGGEVELRCTDLGFGGKGVCRSTESDLVVFCERALPGERLVARVDSIKRRFVEAHKVSTLEPHINEVEAPCEHFGQCGGCTFQNLAYEHQLRHKQAQVVQLLRRVGKVADAESIVRPIVPAPAGFGYRNKMEFAYGASTSTSPSGGDGVAALGLKRNGSYHAVVDVEACPLQSAAGNRALAAVRALAPPGGTEAAAAGLKRIMIRVAQPPPVPPTADAAATADCHVMVVLVTDQAPSSRLTSLAAAVAAAVPEVVSVVSLLEPGERVDDEQEGGEQQLLWGAERLRMHLAGVELDVSAKSFFQTNTAQGNTLVQVMAEACGLKGDGSEVVLDLYCGVGLLGIALAHRCREVWGVELEEAAVADATHNAVLNRLTNCTFFQGDLGKVAASLGKRIPRPDVVVVDPNRAGCPPSLTAFLRRAAAPTVVYVSCNPATQARDVAALCGADDDEEEGQGARYDLISVTPIDMFPHTAHVETVAVLRRRDS